MLIKIAPSWHAPGHEMPRPSLLTGTLALTNALLLAYILLPRRVVARWLRRLTTSVRPQLGRTPSDQSVAQSRPQGAALGGLLGKDYLPPLPQPVADALDRSCLCFLATAGSESERVEPHLSLMRFTYTSGLDPNDDGGRSEVVVISTQRKTKKFDILTRNENVALLVHDFTTHREGQASGLRAGLGVIPPHSSPRIDLTTATTTSNLAPFDLLIPGGASAPPPRPVPLPRSPHHSPLEHLTHSALSS